MTRFIILVFFKHLSHMEWLLRVLAWFLYFAVSFKFFVMLDGRSLSEFPINAGVLEVSIQLFFWYYLIIFLRPLSVALLYTLMIPNSPLDGTSPWVGLWTWVWSSKHCDVGWNWFFQFNAQFLSFAFSSDCSTTIFLKIHESVFDCNFNPTQDGNFQVWSWMVVGGGGGFLLKICHTYLTMMKLCAVITYLCKIQKLYKSGDTTLEFCWHQHFFTGNQQLFLYQVHIYSAF